MTDADAVTTDRGSVTREFAPLSTHVLDTVRGEPARGLAIRLERLARLERLGRLERRGPPGWHPVAEGDTDADGRLRDWVPAAAWAAGPYRLVFAVEAYLEARRDPEVFFPEIIVAFRVADPRRHHHVPLLLSPFGYTTYRGS